MARRKPLLVVGLILAAAAALPVASQVVGTKPAALPPATRPAFQLYPPQGVRRPTIQVQLAQGYHAGQPMLIAVDEIVTVSPWATQRTETVTEPAIGLPNRKPTKPATTKQVFAGYAYGSRVETRAGAYFVSDRFEDLAARLKDVGWGNVLPLQAWVMPGDPATQPAAERESGK